MRFLAVDMHISVIRDIQWIFEKLGHTVDVWSISGHRKIMGWDDPKLTVDLRKLLPSLYTGSGDIFWGRYRKELEKYDGFIVTYPPALARIFERTGKPIIVHIPIRYEYPYTRDRRSWIALNKWLQRDNVFVSANNEFDQKYYEAYTGVKIPHIPSLCRYTGVDSLHSSFNNPALYYSKRSISHLNDMGLVHKDSIYPSNSGYGWHDTAKHKYIVHVPYQVSTMSIFELSSMNMLQLFPTRKYLYQLLRSGNALQEVSWGCPRLKPVMDIPDPNWMSEEESFWHWIDYADYYNDSVRNVKNYESYEVLKCMIDQLNCEVSIIPDDRQELITSLWRERLKEICR